MGKKQTAMIDSLFGSKTRVKLLHLFFNNPGKAFYVREITRLIDEQINSVRRELSNMLQVGIIESSTADNKLYYEVHQRYEHFSAFRSIFGDDKASAPAKPKASGTKSVSKGDVAWQEELRACKGIRVAIAAGALVEGSASGIDLLVAGPKTQKLANVLTDLETSEGRELTYSIMSYDEFYYRLSVRDKFIADVISNRHEIVIDTDKILTSL